MSHLYGPANPKTLIPPIIVPPIADFASWRNSSATNNNYINSENPFIFTELSGYDVTSVPVCTRRQSVVQPQAPNFPAEIISNISPYDVQMLGGPNSWTVTERAGVNSNIGISSSLQTGFSSRFGANGGDYQLFVESKTPFKAPFHISSESSVQSGEAREAFEQIRPDPRAYSFGPASRIRIDPDSGIPSYHYEDIDAQRIPRYISRNTTNSQLSLNGSTNDAKAIVQEQFISDSNMQRLDLQNSLMRKRNSELWQLKIAPISPGKFC